MIEASSRIAGDAAEAPDDHRDEAFQPNHRTHLGGHEEQLRQQHAGQRGEHAGIGEGSGQHLLKRDSHQDRRLAVDRDRPHDLADHRALQDDRLDDGENEDDDKDQHLLPARLDPADVQRAKPEGPGLDQRLRTVDDPRQFLQEDPEADRRYDGDQGPLLLQACEHQAREQRPERL